MDSLIRKYRVDQTGIEGAIFSTIPDSAGHFKVPWNKVISFWKDYCELFTYSPEAIAKGCLYEYNGSEATLRVLFRFIYSRKAAGIVTEKFLCLALGIVQEVMRDFSREDDDESLRCIVSQTGNISSSKVGSMSPLLAATPAAMTDDIRTDVEFKFPQCRISQAVFNEKILPEIKQRFRLCKLTSSLATEPIGDWNKIVQPMNGYFPLHGTKTCPDPWGQPLELYKCSGIVNMPIEDGQELIDEDLHGYLEASEHSWLKSRASGQRSIMEKADDAIDFTPMILSSFFSNEITSFHFPDDADLSASRGDRRSRGVGSGAESDVSSADQTEMVQYLVPLISKSRLRNDMYWTELGRTLFNIFRADRDAGFEFWNKNDISAEPREEYNRDKWEQFYEDSGVNDFLSIRTIAIYAREDNRDRYDDWHMAWMEESVRQSLSVIENDVAEVLYRYLWLDFMTVGANSWYKFDVGATRLKKLCSNTNFLEKFPLIVKLYSSLQSKFNDETVDISDPKKGKKAATGSSIIGTIIKKLGTTTFQNAMIKQCFVKFYRDGADEFFDSNPNLISWQNVVSHVHGTEIYVRSGKMEDFLTKTTRVSLDTKTYSMRHPLVIEVMDWFEKMFPEEDFLTYFMKICSSFLYGKNAEKFFIVWSGSGDNGKSLVIKLLQKVLGDYAVDFPVELLTGNKAHSSGPSPELAQAKGARVGFVSEPESSIPLRCGNIKRYTGGDRFYARMCNENGSSIDAMFKMVFTCNQIPQIEGADTAMVNRFRYLPFLITFADDAPETLEEQRRQKRYPKDPFFENKLDSYRRPMAWLMFHYFSRYRIEGLKISPRLVDEYTKRHWEDNDPYQMFFREYMQKDEDSHGKLNATAMYQRFKPWYKSNFPTGMVPDQRMMTNHMSARNRLGPQENRCWLGWKMRSFESADGAKDGGERTGPTSGTAGGKTIFTSKKSSGIA